MKHDCKKCAKQSFCEKARHIENYRIDECGDFMKDTRFNRFILRIWRKIKR